MDRKRFNQYKKAHKDMMNYIMKEETSADNYIYHLENLRDKGEQVFIPQDDLLYFPCAYAMEVYNELCLDDVMVHFDDDLMCEYCPLNLKPGMHCYNEKYCEWWMDIPNTLVYCLTTQEFNKWKKDMRTFRDLKWDEKWVKE